MVGLFRVKYNKVFEFLDYGEIPDEDRKILFQGKKYDPENHRIYRLPIQIEPIRTKKKTARYRRRKSYEKVTQALVWARIESQDMTLVGMLPNSTFIDGEQETKYSQQAILDQVVSPLTKLQLSGKAEQSFRRKQRIIIASRTSNEAQWAFGKIYLRDNLGFNLVFVFEFRNHNVSQTGLVRIKLRFMDKGREVLSPKSKLISISASDTG
ncbi:MAG: hypothetical protein ABIJ39_02200 [Chloroflexota bacterium]